MSTNHWSRIMELEKEEAKDYYYEDAGTFVSVCRGCSFGGIGVGAKIARKKLCMTFSKTQKPCILGDKCGRMHTFHCPVPCCRRTIYF